MSNTFADQIPLAVRQIMGDSFDVIWRDEETGTRDLTHCELSVISDIRHGWDEVRLKPGTDPGDLKERISGNRTLRIQFFCESDAQPLGAMTLAEDLQIGLARVDVREILSLASLGACSLGPCMDASYRDDDGRKIAAVMFEAAFPRTVTRDGATIKRVRTVEVSGTVTHEDATTTPIGPFEISDDE